MKTAKKPQSVTVVFVLEQPEMKLPYEQLLKNTCRTIHWCKDGSEIDNIKIDGTVIFIVDLDTLGASLSENIEVIKRNHLDCEVIGLTSEDSAKLVVEGMKNGVSDFLVKPVSPEELQLAVRRASERHAFSLKMNGKTGQLLRAVSQISASGSPSLLRIVTTSILKKISNSSGAIWITRPPEIGRFNKVLAETAKSKINQSAMLAKLDTLVQHPKQNYRWKNKNSGSFLLFCKTIPFEAIYVWGVPLKIAKQSCNEAQLILEQAENSLLNMEHLKSIKQQTFIDDLTGLYNSRYLRFALQSVLAKNQNKGAGFSVFFIDLDRFKSVNDQHGHLVGSEFLVTIGRAIKHTVRSIDPVFRYGGDEFVVLLSDTSLSGAIEIAERIRKNIERRVFVIQGKRLSATVSIGVAHFPTHAKDIETLLQMADTAMYAAKRISRNAVHIAEQNDNC